MSPIEPTPSTQEASEGADGVEPVDDRPKPDFGGSRRPGVAIYLGMAVSELGDGTEPLAVLQGPFDAPDHVTDAEGRTPTGVLAALVDSIGGLASGIASMPDWIVTTNLTLRRSPATLSGPSGTGPLVLDTEVLRRGRSAVVTRTAVSTAEGTPVATGWMTCAVLTPTGGPPPITRPVRPFPPEPVDDPAFALPPDGFFGLREGTGPGVVALDIIGRVRNPWGILHGGAMTVLSDVAARSAVAGTPALEPTPGLVTSDLITHYLSPGRVGPVVASAEVLGRRDREHLVRVIIRDHGADDRLLVESVVTVRHAG
jgi:acyl-coenzyme A thioesterase PaaI-like protein